MNRWILRKIGIESLPRKRVNPFRVCNSLHIPTLRISVYVFIPTQLRTLEYTHVGRRYILCIYVFVPRWNRSPATL